MKRCTSNAFAATGPLVVYGKNNPPYDQQKKCPLNILPKEIFYQLAEDQLRAKNLEALGQTCKHFKKITGNAPMWQKLYLKMKELGSKTPMKESYKKTIQRELKKNNHLALLSRVYFECDNHYAKRNIPKGIRMADKIIRQGDHIEESHLIQAILKKAELLLQLKSATDDDFNRVIIIADAVLNNETASKEEKAQANYLKAMKAHLWPNEDDNDLDIYDSLNKAHLDENLPHVLRIEAKIAACEILKVKVTDHKFTKQNSLDYLETITHDHTASIEQRALAAIHLAEEFYKEETVDKDLQAEKLLKRVIDDLDVSDGFRMDVAFNLVVKRFEHRATLLEDGEKADKEAVKFLQLIKECVELDDVARTLADFYLALFRCEKRIDVISDEQAFDFLQNIEIDDSLDEYTRYEASLYQAILHYEDRVKRLTDEDAIGILDEIINDPGGDLNKLKPKAQLCKALILYQLRDHDKEAYELFGLVTVNNLANENDRKTAIEYGDKMLNSGRGPKYFDNPCGRLFLFGI